MIGTSFSVFFFGVSPQDNVVRYNGIKFVNSENPNEGKLWIAKINGADAAFSFLPAEVEDVLALDDFPKALKDRLEIDVAYDLNNTYKESIALAQHQMDLTLAEYNIYLRKGFTTNNTFNLPVITCNDATLSVPVVYFKYGNLTSIHVSDNCVIAEASSNSDFIKVKDRLLYGILGVIK